MGQARKGHRRARGARAERARRRQPRAGRVVPAVRARHAAHVPPRGKSERRLVLARIRGAHRGDDRLPRRHHGRRRQRAPLRRRRRRLSLAPRSRPRFLAAPLGARHGGAPFPPRRLQAEGRRTRRSRALAARQRRRAAVRRAAAGNDGPADALSLTLSVGGREFLVDPGTYAYHTQERWREYFRGTAAHNTVRIDGRDQSEQGGNFMWVKHARAGCGLWLSSAEKDTFEGWHDGYMRLADPVKHRRLLELDKRARRLVIEDSLTMAEEHEVELFFHCAEDCRVDAVAEGYLVERDGIRLHLALPAGGSTEIYRGSLSPLCGWISRGFDRRAPTSTIVWRAKLASPTLLRTEIAIQA